MTSTENTPIENKIISTKKYNCTQLTPQGDFERHVYNRDAFAHYFRWSHALDMLRRDMKVLDFGCGSGEFAEVIYRNRMKSEYYLGYDIRKKTIANNKQKVIDKFNSQDWINFAVADLCDKDFIAPRNDFDLIVSFEVIEHIGRGNGPVFLENMVKHMNENTTALISTPCFNGKCAKNHIIDGKVGEFEYEELKELLKRYFVIENVFGTFCSQRDIKAHIPETLQPFYDELKKFHHPTVLAVMFAPLFPAQSRNCIWQLKLKKQE